MTKEVLQDAVYYIRYTQAHIYVYVRAHTLVFHWFEYSSTKNLGN